MRLLHYIRKDDEERMNRRGLSAMTFRFSAARARTDWCIVGTAVYHVGLCERSHSKNRDSSKPDVHTMLAPAANVLRVAPIKP